jgi:hypothetical protein
MTNDSSPVQRTKGPIPLRDIPFSIVVDGVEVRGRIACLYPNDITVEITDPVAGLSSRVHIPYFAMSARSVATSIAPTAYGRETAEWLLKAIYDHSRGLDPGWGVCNAQTKERLKPIDGIQKDGK